MTGQLRIIVLDTSPTTRKVLEVILHREGYLVACFDDPLEALRALYRHGAADLLFLCLKAVRWYHAWKGIERANAACARHLWYSGCPVQAGCAYTRPPGLHPTSTS